MSSTNGDRAAISKRDGGKLAKKVRKHVRFDARMKVFRDHIKEYQAVRFQQQRRQLRWQNSREKFVARYAKYPRMCDESAGPPKEGWRFQAVVKRNPSDECHPEMIYMWVPKKLLRENEPQVHAILPILRQEDNGKPESLSLAEKYATLGAVHDCFSKGLDKINPWPSNTKLEGIAYHLLLREIPKLPRATLFSIEAFLDDVDEDIETRQLVACQDRQATDGNAGSTHDASKPRSDDTGLHSRDTHSQATQKSSRLPKLGPHDRQAWKLSLVEGMTQEKIATMLNKEHGTSYCQGGISRMIQRAKQHADASGLSDHIPKRGKPAINVDPSRLNLGARTDGRSSRER